MATTVEAKIEVALETRLEALVTTPTLPIAWTGKTFNPPVSKKYLQVQFVPNINNRVFLGSDDPHQRLGILQMSLHWPFGDFERVPRDVAGAIAAHFPTDLRLIEDGVEVRVMKYPEVAGALIGDHDMQIPITVEFEAWA